MTPQERLEPQQDLASDAIHHAKNLLAAELSLARRDLQHTAAAAARSALAFGIAGLAALAGIESLVVSAAVGGRSNHPARAAGLGLGLLAFAAAAALYGRAKLPPSPLPIASRVASDLEDVARRAI